MNSVGQSGDRKSYRVVVLLIVGLTAFSSAMKELNQLREFTRETSDLVASWSKMVAPSSVPPAAAPEVVVPAPVPPSAPKVEVCESSLRGGVAPAEEEQAGNKDEGKTVVAERSGRRDAAQVAALRSHRSAGIDIVELRKQARREADLKLMILADSDGEAEIALPSEVEIKLPKMKPHRQIWIRPEDRELFKGLNRSFNVRSAG